MYFSGSLVLFAEIKYNEFGGKNPGSITLGTEVELLYSLAPIL